MKQIRISVVSQRRLLQMVGEMAEEAFHVTLLFLTLWPDFHKPTLKAFVDHRKGFDATDSDGVGI